MSDQVAIIGVTGSRVDASQRKYQLAGLIRVVDGGGPDTDVRTERLLELPGPIGRDSLAAFTNEMGNVVVTGTRPLPTSKDQCKNGGWKTFGVFKNQGDCVSFVATGGKNPRGGP